MGWTARTAFTTIRWRPAEMRATNHTLARPLGGPGPVVERTANPTRTTNSRWTPDGGNPGRLGDAQLLQAVASGDGRAMSAIHDRHADRVRAALSRRIADQAVIDEVVQDAFVTLWRHPERWDARRGTLPALLVVIARGRAIDALRSEAARRTREQRSHRWEAPDVESSVMVGVDADQVRSAVASLPESERLVINLAFFGHRTYREVAVELGRPEGTVKSQIRSGLRRLRPLLGHPAFTEAGSCLS